MKILPQEIQSELILAPFKIKSGTFLLPKQLSYSNDLTRIGFTPKGREWVPALDVGDSFMTTTRDVTPWSSKEIEYLIKKKGFQLAKDSFLYILNLEQISKSIKG
jgi:hypothetical protein